ncbi:MAG: MotA/TolQ/ExbB proton channel family protein, partial [Pseudomonadota bacterium]|nr:MotA/TolQ/ExbB proton channel family protein [Pseudomonadota bacterium]
AVVAPGIAEALFATALGLFAAIPAVVAYNKLSTELGRYAARLESFVTEFVTLLERQHQENVVKASKTNKRRRKTDVKEAS